jgi:radical SAM protein with 4Fe4S-binding SPASM domain
MPETSTLPVIIQATNRSGVFESKVLARLTGGDTVLAYLINRLKKFWAGPILLATSNEEVDDTLAEEARTLNVPCFRGAQNNLISRLSAAATQMQWEHFVRVYGSYPLIDLSSLAQLVAGHLARQADYSYNEHRLGVPWGMGCEVIKTQALKKLAGFKLSPEQEEAGTLFIRQNPGLFKIYRLDSPLTRPDLKLALETEKDLFLLEDIVCHVPEPDLAAVVAYLDEHPILASSNLQDLPPQEVGLEKLYLHPGKVAALLSLAADEVDRTYPISVELSLTNRCNLKCVWCSDGDLRKRQGVQSTLDEATLWRLFDDLKAGGTAGVVLEGGGEPTLHPGFDRVVARLREVGLAVGLITNGLNNLSSDTLRAMEWIRVSLDASTPEEFQAFKGHDGFERVLSNVYNFAAHCATVGIGYVVTNRNLYDMESLVLRLRRYGVSYIQFRPVIDCPELAPPEMDLSYLKRYQNLRFSVILDGMRENSLTSNDGLPCKAHSLTTVIGADGSIYLCGRLNIYPWFPPMGNIRDATFKEIWHGEARRNQAQQVLDNHVCETYCPQCRLAKFNQLFARLERTRSTHFI